jgi:hypothetical protein
MSKKQNGAYVLSSAGAEFVAGASTWTVDTGGNLNLYQSSNTNMPMATFAATHWAGVKLSATSGSSINESQTARSVS